MQDDEGGKDDEDQGELNLAGSLRLLSSSRSNISRVEPGQLLNLDDRETDVKVSWFNKNFTSSSFRLAGLPPCCCCWLAGGSLWSISETTFHSIVGDGVGFLKHLFL